MIIEIQNLSKKFRVKKKEALLKSAFFPSYKEFAAVEDISFSVGKGESVALLGPNGAGKTTTMKILTGLIYPTSGLVNVLGYFPFDRKKDFLKKIGLVMGNKVGLEWDLTPRQSLGLTQKIYQISDNDFEERLKELSDLLQTSQFMDTQVRKLSLGERLKLEVINSILHNPEVLFLDEPTIGLDIVSKQNIRHFLRELQRRSGVTLLLTSHDMSDIEKVCDRVIVINKGLKVYDDSLKNLTSHYSKEKHIKFIFLEKPSNKEFEKFGKVTDTEGESITLKIASKDMPKVIARVAEKYKLLDIDILSVPLDEIISDIYLK
jgi:ABC-2 type transport system ATP-binding protein